MTKIHHVTKHIQLFKRYKTSKKKIMGRKMRDSNRERNKGMYIQGSERSISILSSEAQPFEPYKIKQRI